MQHAVKFIESLKQLMVILVLWFDIKLSQIHMQSTRRDQKADKHK